MWVVSAYFFTNCLVVPDCANCAFMIDYPADRLGDGYPGSRVSMYIARAYLGRAEKGCR